MADIEKLRIQLQLTGDLKKLEELKNLSVINTKVKLNFDKDSVKALENLDKLKTGGFQAKIGLKFDSESVKALETLDKLKTKGFSAKMSLDFDKSSIKALENLDKLSQKGFDTKVRLDIDRSNGGGLKKLESFEQKGIIVKAAIKLVGSDTKKLTNLIERGATIRVNKKVSSRSNSPRSSTQSQLEYAEEFVDRAESAYAKTVKSRRAETDRLLAQYEEIRQFKAKQVIDNEKSASMQIVNDAVRARRSQLSAQSLTRALEKDQEKQFNQENRKYSRLFTINQSANLKKVREEEQYNRRLFSINQSANIAKLKEEEKQEKQEEAYNKRLFSINQSVNLKKSKQEEKQKELKKEAIKEGAFGVGLSILGGGGGLGEAAGSLLGSAAVASLLPAAGPGAVLAGGAIGAAVIKSTIEMAKQLTEAFVKVSEAGRSFESSILGIASVLNATTVVRTKSGSRLSSSDTLNVQQDRAVQIQKAARSRLLPLGISGEREATLVQAIIAGAAQRGIQLDSEQASVLAERLGGAIQAQRPELLNNSSQLRRDVEDLLSGLPNRTVLSSLVKGFAPGLGKATSAEQLLRASEGLASFPVSLKNSANNPIVAFQKFNASIDQLATSSGDALNKALVPALQRLSDTVGSPAFISGASKLADLVGRIASFAVSAATGENTTLSTIGKALGGPLAIGAASTVDFVSGLGTNEASFNILGRNLKKGSAKTQLERDKLELENLRDAREVGLISPAATAILGLPGSKESLDKRIADLEKSTSEVDVKTSAATKLESLLAQGLGESGDLLQFAKGNVQNSPEARLQIFRAAADQIPLKLREQVERAKLDKINTKDVIDGLIEEAQLESFGSKVLNQNTLQEKRAKDQSLFDTSVLGGESSKLVNALESLPKILESQVDTLSQAEELRNKTLLSPTSGTRQIVEADARVTEAQDRLIQSRKEERDAIIALRDAELSRTKALRESTIDVGTFEGRRKLAESNIQSFKEASASGRANIDFLRLQAQSATGIEAQNIQNAIQDQIVKVNRSEIGKVQASRDLQNEAIAEVEGQFQLSDTLANFKRSTEAAADRMQGLSDQLASSQRTLADFEKDTKLRQLGRKGRILASARNALKTAQESGSLSDVTEVLDVARQAGLSRFDVDGSGLIDPNKRIQVETATEEFRRAIDINSPERGAIEDQNYISSVRRQQRDTERELDAGPEQDRQRKLSTLKNLVSLKQQGISSYESNSTISSLSKELGIKLPELEKAQTIESSLPANVDKITLTVNDILLTLKELPGKISINNVYNTTTGESSQTSKESTKEGSKEDKEKGLTISSSNPILGSIGGIADLPLIKEIVRARSSIKTENSPISDAVSSIVPTVISGISSIFPQMAPTLDTIASTFKIESKPKSDIKEIAPLPAYPAAFGIADTPFDEMFTTDPKKTLKQRYDDKIQELNLRGAGPIPNTGAGASEKDKAIYTDIVDGLLGSYSSPLRLSASTSTVRTLPDVNPKIKKDEKSGDTINGKPTLAKVGGSSTSSSQAGLSMDNVATMAQMVTLLQKLIDNNDKNTEKIIKGQRRSLEDAL